MRKILLLCFVWLFTLSAFAQNKYTISGYAKDAQNGETLIGASIAVNGKTKGIATNQYGFYSITLLSGEYTLICTYAGYQPKVIVIKLDADKQQNFELLTKEA